MATGAKIDRHIRPTLRVLVADDREDNRRTTGRIVTAIKEFASDIREADGLDAVRRFIDGAAGECFIPHIVLLDINFGTGRELEGIGILKEIARKVPSAKVIIITAYPSIELSADCMQANAYRFIVRPSTPDKIQQAIRDAAETVLLRKKLDGITAKLQSILNVAEAAAQKVLTMEQIARMLVNDLREHLAVDAYLLIFQQRNRLHIIIVLPLLGEDLVKEPVLSQLLSERKAELRAGVVVPMRLGGEMKMLMHLYFRDEVHFEQEICDALLALAEETCVVLHAMEYAQKHAELQAAEAREKAALAELNTATVRADTTQRLMSAAVHTLAPTLNALGLLVESADELKDNGALRENVGRLVSGLAQVRDRCKDLSRAERVEPVDLVSVARNALEDHRAAALQCGARIECNYVEPQLVVKANEFCLRGILSAILTNAIESLADIPEGNPKLIAMSLSHSAVGVRCSISDTGGGIPEADLALLGNSPVQTAKKQDHLGLGLFTAKQMIERWGGDLAFESTLGRGTIVTVQVRNYGEGSDGRGQF
ncbi:MAG: hybrid sensor histidine kinase/response regulator [Candidatus Hydrogenedentes bacterium]|nr:hybrid sensor histidine kinase/response regulator [Candidatus Hydrogenedentota bacterium]